MSEVVVDNDVLEITEEAIKQMRSRGDFEGARRMLESFHKDLRRTRRLAELEFRREHRVLRKHFGMCAMLYCGNVASKKNVNCDKHAGLLKAGSLRYSRRKATEKIPKFCVWPECEEKRGRGNKKFCDPHSEIHRGLSKKRKALLKKGQFEVNLSWVKRNER